MSISNRTGDFSQLWAPLVLSLDGGGVRGLSSLYILRELMKHIKRLDAEDLNDKLEPNIARDELPLPCHYFDFMVGTSTGGLIAIMLGRLRMHVNDCIKQYWRLSVEIFRPRRTRLLFQVYSKYTLQQMAKEIVKKFCRCHAVGQDQCHGEEYLRQYDYGEEDDVLDEDLKNKTCKVAVVTVREGGRTDFVGSHPHVKVLFRSYNHRQRDPSHRDNEPNPKRLDGSTLQIHEACCATVAAPTYFHKVELRGRKYVDGGIMANNPSVEAWNEAKQMANSPARYAPDPAAQRSLLCPNILVSVGTGKKEEFSGTGRRALVWYGLRKITDTQKAHEEMKRLVEEYPWRYHRFDVPNTKIGNSSHKGLGKIKLDSCKKRKKRTPSSQQDSQQQNALVNQARKEDKPLQEAVKPTPAERRRRRQDHYRPDKYDYTTFDKLRDRTMTYCSARDEAPRILDCARLLRRFQVERKRDDAPRWDAFREHPDPLGRQWQA